MTSSNGNQSWKKFFFLYLKRFEDFFVWFCCFILCYSEIIANWILVFERWLMSWDRSESHAFLFQLGGKVFLDRIIIVNEIFFNGVFWSFWTFYYMFLRYRYLMQLSFSNDCWYNWETLLTKLQNCYEH